MDPWHYSTSGTVTTPFRINLPPQPSSRRAWDGWKIEEPTKESIDMPDNEKPRLFPFRAVAWNTDSNEVLFDEGVVMAVDSTSARNKVVKQLVVANAEIDLDEVEIAVHPF